MTSTKTCGENCHVSSKPLRTPTQTASLSLAFFGSRKPKKNCPPFRRFLVKNAFFWRWPLSIVGGFCFACYPFFLKKNENICRKSKRKWIFSTKMGRNKSKNLCWNQGPLWKHHWENHGNLRGPPHQRDTPMQEIRPYWGTTLVSHPFNICWVGVALGGDTVRFPWEKDVRNLRCFEWRNGMTILNSSDASKTRHFTRIGIPQIISGTNGKWK